MQEPIVQSTKDWQLVVKDSYFISDNMHHFHCRLRPICFITVSYNTRQFVPKIDPGVIYINDILHVKAYTKAMQNGGHMHNAQIIHIKFGSCSGKTTLLHLPVFTSWQYIDAFNERFPQGYLSWLRVWPRLMARVHSRPLTYHNLKAATHYQPLGASKTVFICFWDMLIISNPMLKCNATGRPYPATNSWCIVNRFHSQ